jgi:uncharacterized membrane protein
MNWLNPNFKWMIIGMSLKFVAIIFISLSYFKSQNYMKIIRKNLLGIANLHISTIFLLKAGTVPTVWYICAPGAPPPKIGKNKIFWRKIVIFHTKYPTKFRASLCIWKKSDFLGVKSWFFTRKKWLWSSSVIKIVKMKYNRIDIKWWLASTSFKIYLEMLSHENRTTIGQWSGDHRW